jgi:hypothetical protein
MDNGETITPAAGYHFFLASFQVVARCVNHCHQDCFSLAFAEH